MLSLNSENEAKRGYGDEMLNLLGPIVPNENEVVYSRKRIKSSK